MNKRCSHVGEMYQTPTERIAKSYHTITSSYPAKQHSLQAQLGGYGPSSSGNCLNLFVLHIPNFPDCSYIYMYVFNLYISVTYILPLTCRNF